MRLADELHDLEAILTVGDIGEQARVGHAELDVARVVDASLGVERLVEARGLRTLDVDDDEPRCSGGDIAVGARDVEALRIGDGHARFLDEASILRHGHVDDGEPVGIGHEGISELVDSTPPAISKPSP